MCKAKDLILYNYIEFLLQKGNQLIQPIRVSPILDLNFCGFDSRSFATALKFLVSRVTQRMIQMEYTCHRRLQAEFRFGEVPDETESLVSILIQYTL